MRAQGGPEARDIDIPLPLSGIYSEAKNSEVSGVYASVLENLNSNGVNLEFSKSPILGPTDETALRRIPFEFGAFSQYIEITSTQVNSGVAALDRAVAEDASHAYISSQAVIVDGRGNPITFDGGQFVERVWTTDTGLDPALFDGVVAHQDRLFFWRRDGDLEFYYADDVGAVQGNLTRFPLGRLGNITGQIVGMVSLTIDASEDLNDSLCIMTSTGQVVVYEGTDPSDPQNWRISARVKSAPPISRSGFTSVGGDVWMMTTSGIVSVLDSIRKGVLALVGNLSRPISDDIQRLVDAGGGTWQLHTAATGDQVIINRYDADTGTAEQFIYFTESPSWATANYPAKRWHNLGLQTEYTNLTGVRVRLGPREDGTVERTVRWHTGWFNLRKSTEIKYIKPTVIAKGPLEITITVLSDHDETESDVVEAVQTMRVEPDNPADPNGRVALNEIFGVDAVGQAFQFRMEITAVWAKIVSVRAGVM